MNGDYINNVIMPKFPSKQRHSSLINTSLLQPTACFAQDADIEFFSTLNSKPSAFMESSPLQIKYINKENIPIKRNENKRPSQQAYSQKSPKMGNHTPQLTQFLSKAEISKMIERKIEVIVQERLKDIIQNCIKKHFQHSSKENNNHMAKLQAHYQKQMKQMAFKFEGIEKRYDIMLNTYDKFLDIVEKFKDRGQKKEKYARKSQFDHLASKTEDSIKNVQSYLKNLSEQLQILKKPPTSPQPRLKTLQKTYTQPDDEFSQSNFRKVVQIYNENFMQIDEKIKQLYSLIA